MLKLSFLLSAIMSATVAAPMGAEAGSSSASLEVRFEGIEIPTGQVMLTLFDNEVAHDSGRDPVRAAAVKVEDGRAVIQFQGLAPGTYALKAFHDTDGDGQMATNAFGMPIEPFAFSNNAQPEGGPARWRAASFTVEPGANHISITIR